MEQIIDILIDVGKFALGIAFTYGAIALTTLKDNQEEE